MEAATVLVVEDEVLIGQDIRRILLSFGYEVSAVASTGRAAIEAVEARLPDLVLMDIRLKGPLDGVQTAAQLRDRVDVPLVYLTSHADEATFARAKKTAPYGYVIKPFTDWELRVSVEVALGRHALETKSAAKALQLAEANVELVARGEERKRESERLLRAARTDPLTEASNRLHLQEDLEGIADRVRRYGHQYCAAFLDIDAFKSYNDSHGHLAGDNAIRLVSYAIQKQLRRSDNFYRYGGDEFLVLLPEQSSSSARECAERVRAAVESIPVAGGRDGLVRAVTMSIGIADFRVTLGQDAIQSWLRRADAALYRAKGRGRNCVETDP
jgi:diguanylate cyclase (GGDEF)-like protein